MSLDSRAATFVILGLMSVWPCQGRTVGPAYYSRGSRNRLAHDLRTNLSSRHRPELIRLNVTLFLTSLDLDFESGTFFANGWLGMQWNDPSIMWDPAHYEGLQTHPISGKESAWVPPIDLVNSKQLQFSSRVHWTSTSSWNFWLKSCKVAVQNNSPYRARANLSFFTNGIYLRRWWTTILKPSIHFGWDTYMIR